jgi:hypothetical protein
MSNHLTAIAGSNDVAATTTAVSNRIAERRPLIKGALTFFSIKESEGNAARDLVDIERYSRPNHIREAIEKGELVLAAHRSMIGDLSAALVPVTLKDIAVETGDLVLAFPGRDDLAEFTQLLFDHILIEHPLRLVLVVACHHLRCTRKFRPAIAEVLEEIAETVSRLRGIKSFANLEANLDKARAHLLRIEAERATTPPTEMPKQKPPTAPPKAPPISRADYLQQKELQRQEEEADAKAAEAKTEAAPAGLFEEQSEPQAHAR